VRERSRSLVGHHSSTHDTHKEKFVLFQIHAHSHARNITPNASQTIKLSPRLATVRGLTAALPSAGDSVPSSAPACLLTFCVCITSHKNALHTSLMSLFLFLSSLAISPLPLMYEC
jgi:hypothetical protein